MFQAALLAVVLAANPSDDASVPAETPIQRCFATMDGAVYHGDPANRAQMKSDVAACERSIAQLQGMRPTPAQGPEKLFIAGRLLDRAATLSYMGLNDAATALREVRTANLYFRIASGLPSASADYRDAALANVKLTLIQLRTLHADIAARPVAPAYTAYHKL
jgi:hypothetical protein